MFKQKCIPAVCLIFLILFSCNYKKSDENKILGILNYYNVPLPDRFIVLFIPAHGCNSCIRYSIEYAKNNINKCDLIVVVPAYQRKEIKFLFDYNIHSSGNFVKDTLGLSYKEKIVSITPKVFAIIDNKVRFGAVLSGNSESDSDLLKLAQSTIVYVTE